MKLPFRQIHLDFHTSEHIANVGKDFDASLFIKRLKEASVASITVFAKCHHGWSYYPTQLGQPHPHLVRPDLLGEMVQACRENGMGVSIYITVQWDELTARSHPEWHVVRANADEERKVRERVGWTSLSLSNDALQSMIIEQAKEIYSRYQPDGIFFDILLEYDDVSQGAIARMKRLGLDPENKADRKMNERGAIRDFCQSAYRALKDLDKDVRVFFNSGHIERGEVNAYDYQTHFELESLPTGGWGYDHFPISAKYVEHLGKPYLGMTGKFHTTWGEFGGYKKAVALDYECAWMVALGARCSIGDQLHPLGDLDADSYDRIGQAYQRVKMLEPYLEDVRTVAEVAIYSVESYLGNRSHEFSDIGAARMLFELQIPFTMIDESISWQGLRLIIFPDVIRFSPELSAKVNAFIEVGGSILLSGESGLNIEASQFAVPFRAEVSGWSAFEPDYLKVRGLNGSNQVESPLVMYGRALNVRGTGAAVVADAVDPCFNRTHKHFCSHQHAPAREHVSTTRHAALRDGTVGYFAHPIFRMYHEIGQSLYKGLVGDMIHLLDEAPLLNIDLPSGARSNLLYQEKANRYLLHIVYAPILVKGRGINGWHGKQTIETIEESIPLYNVRCELRISEKTLNVYSAYGKEALPYVEKEGKIMFEIPRVDLHQLIVIEVT